MNIKVIIAIVLIATQTYIITIAQTSAPQPDTYESEQYPIDGDLLSALSRDTISELKLQAEGYTPITFTPSEVKKLLRTALLDHQMATTLSKENVLLWQQIFQLAISPSINDPVLAINAISNYIPLAPQDHKVIGQWINYRLNNLSDRQSRDLFLKSQINQLKDYPEILCETLTQKALLSAETGDYPDAISYFKDALSTNPYNMNTIKFLTSLLGTMPIKKNITKEIHLYNILLVRLKVLENPLDLQSVFNLTEKLDSKMAYEMANVFYKYGHALNNTIHQEPDSKYLLYSNQLASNYSGKFYNSCIEISDAIYKINPYDHLARSYKAKAMAHLGNDHQANALYEASIKNIKNKIKLTHDANNKALLYQQLAFYYTVIQIDDQKGFQYAQQALQLAPSDISHEILSLAYLHQKEITKAETTLAQVKTRSQLSILANMMVYFINDQKEEALHYYDNLGQYPVGIIGENIANIVSGFRPDTENINKSGIQFINDTFAVLFNDQDLEIYKAPQKNIKYSLKLEQKSDYYTYGDPIKVNIYLKNNSKSSIMLSQSSWVSSKILITATVEPVSNTTTHYSINRTKSFPTMILLFKDLNQKEIIPPGEYNKVSDYLNVGPLNTLLTNHPQQTFRITFNALINPIKNNKGVWVSNNRNVKAPKLTIIRKGFIVSKNNLQNLYRGFSKVNNVRYINNINLAAALAKEALAIKNGKGRFTFKKININAILNWLNKNLNHDDFRVRLWTLHALRNFPLSKNGTLIANISKCLNDEHLQVAYIAAKTLSSYNINIKNYYTRCVDKNKNDLIGRQGLLMTNQAWEPTTLPYIFEQQLEAAENSEANETQ